MLQQKFPKVPKMTEFSKITFFQVQIFDNFVKNWEIHEN